MKFINQNKEEEISFFDSFTEHMAYEVFTDYGYNRIVDTFLSLGEKQFVGQRRIVDLGCGTGALTERLFKRLNVELFGIDISPNSIRIAQLKNHKIKYSVGDISNLQIQDEFFDVIIYSGVLHHFLNFEPCLREGFRILKKGGCLLSFDPHINNPFMWLYRHPSSPFFSQVGKTKNEQLLGQLQLISFLEKVGFVDINTYALSGITFKYIESKGGRLLLPFYNVLEYFWGKLPIARKYGSFVICHAKKP